MKEEKAGKTPFPHLSTARLGWALTCFAVFLVAGLGAYYLTVGEFVTAELAGIYALLALVGAGAVLLRLRWFAVPYYVGCAAAWVCGSYVGTLRGDFAPTAGAITAAFLIAVFALFGLILQWRAFRRKRLRRKEEKARAEAEAEAGAAEEKAQKEAAAVTAAAATSEQPGEGSEGAGPSA